MVNLVKYLRFIAKQWIVITNKKSSDTIEIASELYMYPYSIDEI